MVQDNSLVDDFDYSNSIVGSKIKTEKDSTTERFQGQNNLNANTWQASNKTSKPKLRKRKGKGRPIGVIATTDINDYPGIPKRGQPGCEKFKYRPKGYYPDFCISKEQYDSIITNHVPNTPFVCSQCKKSFKYRKRFDNHFVPGFQSKVLIRRYQSCSQYPATCR